jgi:hypothetical protein
MSMEAGAKRLESSWEAAPSIAAAEPLTSNQERRILKRAKGVSPASRDAAGRTSPTTTAPIRLVFLIVDLPHARALIAYYETSARGVSWILPLGDNGRSLSGEIWSTS